MVADPTAVGVVYGDLEIGTVVEQAVEYMRGFIAARILACGLFTLRPRNLTVDLLDFRAHRIFLLTEARDNLAMICRNLS
jgi:hypothetical protein